MVLVTTESHLDRETRGHAARDTATGTAHSPPTPTPMHRLGIRQLEHTATDHQAAVDERRPTRRQLDTGHSVTETATA